MKGLVARTDVFGLVHGLAADMTLRVCPTPHGAATKSLCLGSGRAPKLVVPSSVDHNAGVRILNQCDDLIIILPLPQLVLIAMQHAVLFGGLRGQASDGWEYQ